MIAATEIGDRGQATGEARLALHWIGGEWVDSGRHLDSRDPATGDVIGRFADGGAEETGHAISKALQAFHETGWKDDAQRRARVLTAMAERFEERMDELAHLVALENGKILPQARFEVAFAPLTLRYSAGLAQVAHGRAGETSADRLSFVIRQPVGVAGIYAPWNSPVALAVRALGPALAAGCTAVIVLPRQTAQVNALISSVIAETEGLSAGVVNIVTGDREAIGAIVESPDVPVISFTGSTKTGRAISAAGAKHLKRFGLELGGKTPIVVFDDADIEAAVETAVQALIVFSGQFCVTGSRVIVQRSVLGRFKSALAERLAAIRVGPASDPLSEMGPLIGKASVERVDKLVNDAIAGGASVVVRGGPAVEGALAKGAFYRPTLLEVHDSALPIVQQEVFGPVLTLEVFDTEAEAVHRANATEYGLSASVWSRDIDRPVRVARALNAGTVWINDWGTMNDAFEEGGFKQSGQGRLRGLAGLDDFVEYKHIALKYGG